MFDRLTFITNRFLRFTIAWRAKDLLILQEYDVLKTTPVIDSIKSLLGLGKSAARGKYCRVYK